MAPTTITGITAERATKISARLTTLGDLAVVNNLDDAVRAYTATGATAKLAELRENFIQRGEPELFIKTFRSDEKVDHGALLASCLSFFADCRSRSDGFSSWMMKGYCATKDAFPRGTLERSRAAIETMPADDSVSKLTAYGDLFVALQEWNKALAVYRVVGAHKRLVELGERLLKTNEPWHDLRIAFDAYSAAGVPEEYFTHGDRALETAGLDRSIMIYAAGGRAVPEALIEPYARRLVRYGQMTDARRAYSDGCLLPFPRALLLEGIQVYLDNGDLEVAHSLAMEAGVALSQDQLVACGTKALQGGHLIVGRAAFDAAKQSVPSELLIACGEHALKAGDCSDAIEALAAALTGSFSS